MSRQDPIPYFEPASAPKLVAHYRLDQWIGAGGQGEVYLATDLKLERRVAIKFLRGISVSSSEALERFRREAETMSRIEHPSVATIYDVSTEAGTPYLVMRYVEGESLAARLSREQSSGIENDRARIAEVLELLKKVAEALAAAHRGKVLHRDIKPANIMISKDGLPVLLDFGLARLLDDETGMFTRTGDVLGTPAYFAPEQIDGHSEAQATVAVDIYSLGVTLYEALTLKRPFEAPTRTALFKQIREVEPTDPRRLARAIPRDLATVVLSAIAKEPLLRYATVQDLLDELLRCQRGEPVRARRLSPLALGIRFARRHPARASIVLLLCFLGIFLGIAADRWPRMKRELERANALREFEQREELLSEGFAHLQADADHATSERAFSAVLASDPHSEEAHAGLVWLESVRSGRDAAKNRWNALSGLGIGAGTVSALQQALNFPESEFPKSDADASATPFGLFLRSLGASEAGISGDVFAGSRSLRLIEECQGLAPRRRFIYDLQHAIAAHAASDPVSCRVAVEVLRERYPDSKIALLTIARVLAPIDPKAALTAALSYAEACPESRLGFVFAAEACLHLNQFSDAANFAVEARKRAPTDNYAQSTYARALQANGDHEAAIAAFEVVLSRNPHHFLSAYNLTESLLALGQRDRARAELQSLSVAHPKNPRVWQSLARAHVESGLPEEAEAASKMALSLDPRFSLAWNILGTAAEALGKNAEAEAAFRSAMRTDPTYDAAPTHCAQLLLRLGRTREARDLFTSTLALKGLRPDVAETCRKGLSEAEELLAVDSQFSAWRRGSEEFPKENDIVRFAFAAERARCFVLAGRLMEKALAAKAPEIQKLEAANVLIRAGLEGDTLAEERQRFLRAGLDALESEASEFAELVLNSPRKSHVLNRIREASRSPPWIELRGISVLEAIPSPDRERLASAVAWIASLTR